ncbi:MAG: hypothetical protein QNK89_02370 [Lacinutrix sp.]|uniref:hypothetical protein n=1 Tax=Lacinutrix sp. TaxID=1937692 RepID=UPI0030A9111F
MPKKLILFFFLLIMLQNGFAQKSRIVYLNTDSLTITKEEFKAASTYKFYIEKTKTDTLTINILKSKRAYGFLEEKNKTLVFSILNDITTDSINRKSSIFIHSYSDNNRTLKKAKNNNCYWSYINRYPNKFTSFLLTNNSMLKKKKFPIHTDEKKSIENLIKIVKNILASYQ